ncbi:unnamed protein product [Notodromas monacha]|uniref:Uncharacterized protein n=1 Tax=Notodromas monacha TaxID=399045 RepID=A0A7R9GFW9_9CRUS|nr:unnamed protein product [Notodromas monacha]CAG0919582.1 unnamed protein product [Notodromas monacha]
MSDEPQAKKRIMDEELGARVDMTRHPHQSQEDLTVNTVDGEWPFPWQNELASLKADRDRLSRDDVEPSRGSEVKKNGTSPPCEQLTSSSREDVDAANEAEREEFPSLSASMMGRDSRRSYRSSYRRSSGSRNSKGSGRRQQSSHTPNTFNNRLRGRRRNNEEWNGYQYVPPSGMSGEDEEVKPDLNVLLNPREPDWSNPRFSTYNLAELKSARKTLVGLNDPSLSFVDTHCHLDFLLNKLDWSVFSGSLLGQAYEKFKAEREEEFGTLHEACITCFTHPQLFTNQSERESLDKTKALIIKKKNGSSFGFWVLHYWMTLECSCALAADFYDETSKLEYEGRLEKRASQFFTTGWAPGEKELVRDVGVAGKNLAIPQQNPRGNLSWEIK